MPSLHFPFARCRSFTSLLVDRHLKFPLEILPSTTSNALASPPPSESLIPRLPCVSIHRVCARMYRQPGDQHTATLPNRSPRHALLMYIHPPPIPLAARIRSIPSQPGREENVPAMLPERERTLSPPPANHIAEPTRRACESPTAHCAIPGSAVGRSIASSYLERETEQPAP